jgi:pimeloyl-ACP methyl ester carboxylesterase
VDLDRIGQRGERDGPARQAVSEHDASDVFETVAVGGNPLAYSEQGSAEAETLVMLHGLGADHRGLSDLAAGLSGFRIVVPDLPGFGHSAPLPGRHTLREYARVIDGLRQRLGVARMALLGHSFGADVALTYASRYPAAVSDLCLLNPVLGTDGVATRLGVLYSRFCAALPASLARPMLSNRLAVYLQDAVTFTTHDRATRRRILRQDYVTARLADPRAVHESVRSLQRAPFARFARSVSARTLVVSGTQDTLASPDSLTRLPWGQPEPEITVVTGSGHLLPVEQPGRVATIVQEFLDAQRPARR